MRTEAHADDGRVENRGCVDTNPIVKPEVQTWTIYLQASCYISKSISGGKICLEEKYTNAFFLFR